MNRLCFISVAVMLFIAAAASSGRADPLPGEVLKFQQTPMVATPIPAGGLTYYGHDELSTAYGSAGPINTPYQGQFMADDFADRYDTPVVHLRWWGSYMGPEHEYGAGVQQFYVGFESDVPASDTNPFSHPGQPLLEQLVTKGPLAPGSGTFTEKLIRGPDPLIGESLYEYNAELACPFPEERDTVYWLKIVALVDPQLDGAIRWGWHNRDWTIPDPLASTPPAVSPGEGIVGAIPDPSGGTTVPVWHFQDDAVQGSFFTVFLDKCLANTEQFDMLPQNYVVELDGPPPIQDYSKDLAFELYTVPEPASFSLGFVTLTIFTMYKLRKPSR
jgi:hypothetical protein